MMHPTITSTRILLFVAVVGCWTVVFSNARRLHQPLATVVDVDKQQKHQYTVAAATVHHTVAAGVATMEHNNRRRLIRHRVVQAGSTPYAADTTGYSSGYDDAYSNYANPASPQQQQSYANPYATYEQTQTYQTQPQDQAQPQAAQSQYYQYQGQPQVVQAQPQAAQGQAPNQYPQSYSDTYASYEQTQTPAQRQAQGQYQYQTQLEAQAVNQAWAHSQAQAAAQAAAAAQARPQPQQAQQAQQGPYTYWSSPYSTDTLTRKKNTNLRSEGSMGPYVVSSTTTWVGYGEDYDDDDDDDSSSGDEEFALNDVSPPRQQRPDLVANNPITNYTDSSEDPPQPGIFVSEISSQETYSAQEF